jgi:hypothetical protein
VSTVDNVEHLYLRGLPAGTYNLQVERISGGVNDNDEPYALAFDFAPVQSFTAISRVSHGAAGAFDIALQGGVECRAGYPDGSYQVVFQFPVGVTAVDAIVSDGTGTATLAPPVNAQQSREMTKVVNLTGVTSPQTLTVALRGVENGINMSDVAVQVPILVGDVNGDRAVNAGDATIVRNRSGQITDASNFRADVKPDGSINSGDATVVRNRSGQGL